MPNLSNQFSSTRTGTSDLRIVRNLSTTEPVTLEEAKNYVRITNTQDDALITAAIVNARLQCERFLRADIVAKERVVYYDYLNEDINLYYAPIASVDSVLIGGVSQVVDEGYELLGLDNPLLRILQGPAEKVQITYTTAGLDNTLIKTGVMAKFAELYEGRDAVVNTNWKSWLSPFKTDGFYGVR